eukprot:2908351-Rhodomonas_salina.2
MSRGGRTCCRAGCLVSAFLSFRSRGARCMDVLSVCGAFRFRFRFSLSRSGCACCRCCDVLRSGRARWEVGALRATRGRGLHPELPPHGLLQDRRAPSPRRLVTTLSAWRVRQGLGCLLAHARASVCG